MIVFGVILAGGQASRMGGADKAFVTLAGRPLIDHAVRRLRPQVARVLISANGDPGRFSAFGCDIVADAVSRGPLSGILAGMLRAEAEGATHVVSVPVDTPFLPLDLVTRLSEARRKAGDVPVLAATADRDHAAVALWPVALAGSLAGFLAAGEAKVTRFAQSCNARQVVFPEPQAFLNLNTPDDLAAATADRDHAAVALWPVALAGSLAGFLAAGEAKVTRFAQSCNARQAVFPEPQAFLNLNTPDDLAAAEALPRGAA